MSSNKGSFALTAFFSGLFHNFPKLLLTNLYFAVPSAVFFAVFWFINSLFKINSNFVLFLTVIPLFPFYAGVVQVTSHIVRGDDGINVWSNYTAGVKENFVRFLIHGVILYAAILFSYFSIKMYVSLGAENGIFYMLLVISVLICIFFLFVFYYVPSMTVTFDISMKNIYKNSALMSFGELKHNIIATFGVIVLFLLCATVLMCCYLPAIIITVTFLLALFIVPSIMSYIINSAVYKPMYDIIVGKDKKSNEIENKINDAQSDFADSKNRSKNNSYDFSTLDIDESGDADEYIYYNGKMIKRGVLLQMKDKKTEKGG